MAELQHALHSLQIVFQAIQPNTLVAKYDGPDGTLPPPKRSIGANVLPSVACAVTFGAEVTLSAEEGVTLVRFQHQSGDKLTFHWLIRERLDAALSL